MKKFLKFILVLTLLSPVGLFAEHGGEKTSENSEVDIKKEIKQDIKHHLMDAHDFHIVSSKDHSFSISFPLPVILWDEGLKVFMSSKFHHGEEVAEVDGNFYRLYHGKIYKTESKEGNLNLDGHGHPTNKAPLDFSITKNVASIFMISALILFLFSRFAKTYKDGNGVPSKGGKLLEPLVLYVRDEIAIPNIGEKHYRKYMGFLLTVFFFIWIINLFGLSPLGLNITGNIAITSALAIMTFLITNLTGKKTYWAHIFDPLGDSMPLLGKIPLYILLIPIELLGIIIKPFALMIRLYANMQAGHIVLMSIIGLLWEFNKWAGGAFIGLSVFLMVLELLVAALQAYIFTMLTALYFGSAAMEHADH